MTAERQTMITDYDWNETERPIITVNHEKNYVSLFVGGAASMEGMPRLELQETDRSQLELILRGYAEIFEEAAKFVMESGPEAKSAPVPIVKKPYEPD